jgi:hypothetical protein
MTGPLVECRKPNGITHTHHSSPDFSERRPIVKNNETRAWQAWKTTCYTTLVIALLLTVVHVVVGS